MRTDFIFYVEFIVNNDTYVMCKPLCNLWSNTISFLNRVAVEQTIGILKKRFPCLGGRVRLTPEKTCKLIMACAVLHNLAIIQKDSIDPPPAVYVIDTARQHQPTTAEGAAFRQYIIDNYFS